MFRSNIGVWMERGRQLVAEVLRKRGIQTTKGHRSNHGNANEVKVEQQLANIRHGILRSDATKSKGDQSILSGFAHQFLKTQAAQLRRSAIGKMMAPPRRGNLVGFAFVGLALAQESRHKGQDGIGLIPLDVCCKIIKSNFQKPAIIKDPSTEFPSDLASYDLCPKLLGKGCNASVYAARVSENLQTTNNDLNEIEITSNTGSDSSDLDSFEVIPMETSDADADTDNESEESFVVLNAQTDTSQCERNDGELQVEPEKCFDLAIKMMFNYDVSSNALAISRAFEKEYLPLQCQLADNMNQLGMLQWQNGNHVKKKRKSLDPHANIIAMYHAFAGPVDVHDLSEARDMFPAALPRRMHAEGMGRNMSLFIVMKRYDMTLTDYLHTEGCPSQRDAMVIVAQLLEGVGHLVANNIAHRDLKGNNILVNLDPAGGSPHVVLADFGCCLATSDDNLQLPFPSYEMCIGGNTALMAPEVKQAKPGPDSHINYTKSDAWAVGAIAYQVLGLPNPFYRQGNQPGLDSGTYQECELPPLPETTHPALAKVVRLLLKKNPYMRPTPQVAADMLHLSLWQPQWWQPAYMIAEWWQPGYMMVDCLKSSLLVPSRRHIANWLVLVSMATLGSNDNRTGCDLKLWQNMAEAQLCKSWLSRVGHLELIQAARKLMN